MPAPLFEINWKSVTKLPNPVKGHKHKDLENFYTEHLENKPVSDTFKDLKGFLIFNVVFFLHLQRAFTKLYPFFQSGLEYKDIYIYILKY